MINTIKDLFGIGKKVDYTELIKSGAKIIDVRTYGEYASGHVKGSINVPLNELNAAINDLDKDTPLITCCASGIRSASAKTKLISLGFKQVYNGGGWMTLNLKLREVIE